MSVLKTFTADGIIVYKHPYDSQANFAFGVITVAPSPATTGTTFSMSNSDADLFPDPSVSGNSPYNLTIWPANSNPLSNNAEILRVIQKGAHDSGGAGNTQFTCIRLSEQNLPSTITARSIGIGDWVANNVTLKWFTDVQSSIVKPVSVVVAANHSKNKYNADFVCTGTNDDVIINQAIASLPSQGGTVILQAGQYTVGASINVPSQVLLKGEGRYATKIVKASGGYPAINISGVSGNNVQYSGLRDLSVEGNIQTGALLQCHYAQTLFFIDCTFNGADDTALDLMTIQDSYFLHCTMNTNHHASNPVIHIYGSAGGNANMIWFIQCRVEDFWAPAVKIEQGAGYGGSNNGFFFTQCKFESTQVGADMFVADANTEELHMDQIFFSAVGFKSGYSTAVNAINSQAFQLSSYRDIFVNAADTIVNSALNVQSQYGLCTIDNVFFNGNAVTSTIIFNGYSGAAFKIGAVGTDGSAPTITGNPSGYDRHFVAIAEPLQTKSSNYTITTADHTIIASGSGTTITLPDATTVPNVVFVIKRRDASNTITVASNGGNIDGASTYSLSSDKASIIVQSDGTNWQIIGNV